jgi:hypothetical protein
MLHEKQLRSLHTFRLRQESDNFDITSLYLLHHLVYFGYILCIWSERMEFWKEYFSTSIFCSNYNLAITRIDALYRVSHGSLTKFKAQ